MEKENLSVYDKTTHKRITTFNLVAHTNGGTMDDLYKIAKAQYPDQIYAEETNDEAANLAYNGYTYDGKTYTEPAPPTEEELRQQSLDTLDAEYQTKFDDLDNEIVKAAALGNDDLKNELITERNALTTEYETKRGAI